MTGIAAIAVTVTGVIVTRAGVAIAAVVIRVVVTRAGVAVVVALTVVKLEIAVVTGADIAMLVAEDDTLMVSPGTALAVVIGWMTTCGSKAGGGHDTVSLNRLCENPGIMST